MTFLLTKSEDNLSCTNEIMKHAHALLNQYLWRETRDHYKHQRDIFYFKILADHDHALHLLPEFRSHDQFHHIHP